MGFRIRYTPGAREDLRRLYGFLLEKDIGAAKRARDAIIKAAEAAFLVIEVFAQAWA